jgi:RNA-directed DNA polymerase
MTTDADAVIWTEGKTDWQHLKHAYEALRPAFRLRFQGSFEAVGDDQLLKQCTALSKVEQPLPTIFIFDRDKPETVSKVEDSSIGFKSWGNGVYSFAIPIPPHRQGQGLCIEKYYSDSEIQTHELNGRRLLLSSEFNTLSGRHL